MGSETPSLPSHSNRKPVPKHGKLDHYFLKPLSPPPPTTNTYTAGTPAEYRETLRQALQVIDALNQKDKT